MILRLATEEDIPAMRRIRSRVRENVLSDPSVVPPEAYRKYQNGLGRTWVCLSAGQIVGFAAVNVLESRVWALFVDPEFEGRGFGRALHDTMLDWMRQRGARSMILGTQPGSRASRLYEAAGWKQKGTELDPHGDATYEIDLGAPGS